MTWLILTFEETSRYLERVCTKTSDWYLNWLISVITYLRAKYYCLKCLLFWFRTMKTPVVHYQRCMVKVSYFRLIRFFFFFHLSVVTKYHSKDPQRNVTNINTDVIYWTVLAVELWLSTSRWSRNKRCFMPLASVIVIRGFQWIP